MLASKEARKRRTKKSKASRRKEIIKIRAEINEKDKKKKKKKETRRWFFEKVNKQLINLQPDPSREKKKKKKKKKGLKIRNEGTERTTDHRNYFKRIL